jgi:hypothetical protein
VAEGAEDEFAGDIVATIPAVPKKVPPKAEEKTEPPK